MCEKNGYKNKVISNKPRFTVRLTRGKVFDENFM